VGTATEAIITEPKLGERTSRRSIWLLAGVTGAHAVSHFLSQAFLVALPTLRDELGINAVQIGALMSAREVAGGLVSLPGGILCDRTRRLGLVLATTMAGFGVGWLIVGLAPTYAWLILGMMVVAISGSLWHLPAMTALSQAFAGKRGMALSIHGVGGNIGDVFGPIITGFLLAYLSWRGLVSAYAVIPFILAAMVLWGFRDRGSSQRSQASMMTIGAQLRASVALLKDKTLWRLNVIAGLRSMCYQVYTTFLPLYLADELGFDSKAIGVYLALMFSVAIVVTPFMGYLSDRLGRKAMLVPTLAGSCILTLLLAFFGEGVALIVVLALLGLFLRSDYSLVSAAVLDAVGEKHSGTNTLATTALGIVSFNTFLFSAISPLIAGALYQNWGMDAALYYAAALFAIATIILINTPLARRPAPAG
jgi:FSR family fosmidomycin resistance protein-like MFS transporter